MGFIAVYITNKSKETAHRLADELLHERLIACANILPIEAAYHWAGGIQQELEWVALVKTTRANWEALKSKVERIHPYEVPCIMKFEVEANEAYEQWIREMVQPNK